MQWFPVQANRNLTESRYYVLSENSGERFEILTLYMNKERGFTYYDENMVKPADIIER